ncbi:MAG TPA: hypothetical protein PKD86_06915 [Gemmatales bacterium]|nr:hypothetical protein [Gemmatales bacterium]HMP59066.1 hypothetical protein [Gemmatales bacterium]
MSDIRLQALKEQIQRVLEQAANASEPEAKANLSSLACVLTSALVEVACRVYVGNYAQKRADTSVSTYVCTRLYFFQNGKTDDITKLLRDFSSELAVKFTNSIGEQGKDAVDSVVSKKNEIVHGKGAGIGLDTMKRYHKDVLSALDKLRDLLA